MHPIAYSLELDGGNEYNDCKHVSWSHIILCLKVTY